jgi:glycosyltransferase involved in cell wall biosynthesis
MTIPAPVSVVIPAHNAEEFLEDAIRSVQLQTVRPSEIIVVANGCTDRTAKISAQLGCIVLEHDLPNMAAALNIGVRASSNPWIALQDADDVWEDEKLFLQLKAIEECKKAPIIACDVSTLMDNKITTRSDGYLRDRWIDVDHVLVSPNLRFIRRVDGRFLTRFFITTSTVLVRRDLFSEVGFFDEELVFGQTLEFFARVMARWPLAFVEKPLTCHRVHKHNHTHNLAAYWPSYANLVERMLKYPERYPEGAGREQRAAFKRDFHQTERFLHGLEAKAQLNKPNQR